MTIRRIFCVLMSLLTAVSLLSVCIMAEDEEKPDSTGFCLARLYDAYGENANLALQKDSTGAEGAVALKPLDNATAEGAWFDYIFDVPADCAKVVVDVYYAASGDRHMELTFDEDMRKVTCPSTSDWGMFNTVSETFENVTAGKHTVRIAAPAEFDNDQIKTPNVESITLNFYLAEGATLPVETEAETEPPATDAPETDAATKAPAENNNGAGTTANTNGGSENSEGGCGSVMGSAALITVMAAVLGCAMIRRKGE